ncbi:aminopeptidase N [Alloscardovia theropitheci]|uniref:Aminopeptidase N n=1 Tax=Alloscardovia theropitheci TaxID=2496842 RepID=A0A4R0R0A2_9BIFI|nr:aminopeptidase N [Alloscardovia theropitheci]TCD54436.1 aminopeptidase N [Alloscardovia theropitheci]
MPGANLTRVEAQERAGIVSNAHYTVHLDVNQGDTDFRTVSTIEFDAVEGASTFVDLIANTVTSVEFNGEKLDPSVVYKDSRVELTNLKAHNTVTVEALAQYSHTGEGMHRSVDPTDGNVYLYTQFEVPDARRVYAVFDQPDIKATFDFSVDAPEGWEVISITPANEPEDLGNGSVRWTFPTTPKMSSYLTAFVAGPYARWNTTHTLSNGREVPMAIYARQALKDAMAKDVDYLFDVTKKGMDFYDQTWGVPYPYAKYDQLFVPEYNAGAMENIGTVTIRDSYIFESKVTDAIFERRDVTVLHELAHMWFGDLVTMKWWNDLWLNESFAEFTSTLATAETTQWKDAWATFASGEKSWGQAQDEMPTTHPIVAEINDIHDTEVNFDGITYAKGASVLKQLVAYVGRKEFFAGIHNYLEKYQYSNATLADLLAELEKTSGRELKHWSKQWLENAGINTITSEVRTSEDGTIEEMALIQSASEEYPVLRDHRLAVAFYDENESGQIVMTERFDLDVTGERTVVEAVAGKKRPAFIMVNEDDLTYTKLRFDAQSLEFAKNNLYKFDSALTRAVVWLSLWDMTRDAQFPAVDFVETSLKALGTEKESTTFRYALGQVNTAVGHYVPAAKRDELKLEVANALFALAQDAKAGSDEQFQLVKAYLNNGSDPEFKERAAGLLDGSLKFDGLDIDNNMRWSIVIAQAAAGVITNAEIDAELALRDTTENREFAVMAKAAIPTAEAKAWAWDQALHNDELTNSQLGNVALGFSWNSEPKLYDEYVAKYADTINWIWENKTFHMAETLMTSLYPSYADTARLVEVGKKWLEDHPHTDAALRRMVSENLDSSERILRVQRYNESL